MSSTQTYASNNHSVGGCVVVDDVREDQTEGDVLERIRSVGTGAETVLRLSMQNDLFYQTEFSMVSSCAALPVGARSMADLFDRIGITPGAEHSRIRKTLDRLNVESLEQLTMLTADDLLEVVNFGHSSLRILEEALADFGINLKYRPRSYRR